LVGYSIQRGPVRLFVGLRGLGRSLLIGCAMSLSFRPLLMSGRFSRGRNPLRAGHLLGARRRRQQPHGGERCRKQCSHFGFPVHHGSGKHGSGSAPFQALHRLRGEMETAPGACKRTRRSRSSIETGRVCVGSTATQSQHKRVHQTPCKHAIKPRRPLRYQNVIR
jgi:hypothetical protein